MKKQAGQDDEEERQRQDQEEELQRLRRLLREGLASGPGQPDTPEELAELRAIARGEERGRAPQPESDEAFHARGDAAAADLARSGKTYTIDEVLEEMRAMTQARRQQLKAK